MYQSDQKGTEGMPERWTIVELVELVEPGRREAIGISCISLAYLRQVVSEW